MPDSLYAGIVSQTYQYNHKIITGEISLDDIAPFPKTRSTPFYRDTVPGAPVPHGLANGVRNTPRDSISVVLAVVSAVLPTSIAPFRLTLALPLTSTIMPIRKPAMLLPRHPQALDWGNMKVILRDMGMDCDVYYKANDYADFQKQVKTSKMTIALVSSANDDKLWQRVPGHYVTLCLYNPTDDTILLGDPGSPTNNRSRVPPILRL